MKLGFCIDLTQKDQVIACKKAGFDYIEGSFTGISKLPMEEVQELASFYKEQALPVPSFNCMFPGKIRLTGPDVDWDAIDRHLTETAEKVILFHPDLIVFGSGGSRNIPEDFDRASGEKQLVALCRDHIAPIFSKYGLRCVIEPLRRAETNVINTVLEGDQMRQSVNLPQVELLADYFHMLQNEESPEDLRKLSAPPVHIHISARDRKIPHSGDGTDYAGLSAVLRDIGYQGRVSVECNKNPGFEEFLLSANRLLRELF